MATGADFGGKVMGGLRRFPDQDAAGEALADELAALLTAEEGGVLALPGGRSPGPLLKSLFSRALPWDRTILTLTDDRWVPPSSQHSNEGQLRAHLAGRPAAAARVVGLTTAHGHAADGLPEVAARLCGLPGIFSAVVAGVGDDGHIASLFPGQPWDNSAALCVVGRAPAPPRDRISLTLARLLATRRMFLLFGGLHRLDLVTRQPAGLPVSALMERTSVPVEIFYYDDDRAAAVTASRPSPTAGNAL